MGTESVCEVRVSGVASGDGGTALWMSLKPPSRALNNDKDGTLPLSVFTTLFRKRCAGLSLSRRQRPRQGARSPPPACF